MRKEREIDPAYILLPRSQRRMPAIGHWGLAWCPKPNTGTLQAKVDCLQMGSRHAIVMYT